MQKISFLLTFILFSNAQAMDNQDEYLIKYLESIYNVPPPIAIDDVRKETEKALKNHQDYFTFQESDFHIRHVLPHKQHVIKTIPEGDWTVYSDGQTFFNLDRESSTAQNSSTQQTVNLSVAKKRWTYIFSLSQDVFEDGLHFYVDIKQLF